MEKSKIYFYINTGIVILITPIGSITLSKDEDFEMYEVLKTENKELIDFIEIDSNLITSKFNNAKSYKCNIETKEIEVIYYTEEELNSMVTSNVDSITEYLSNSDTNTISSVEDSILEIEKNKILGVV